MTVNWTNYRDLLDKLNEGTTWSEARSYSEFREYLEKNYEELGPDGPPDGAVSHGYESLLAELLDEERDEETVYQKFRIIALAYQDPDHAGYVLSADFDNNPVRLPTGEMYTTEPDAWEPWQPATEERVLDQESGLRYDALNWYLPDRDIIVYLSADHPGFSYDDDGNWYDHGKPWTPAEGEEGGAAAANEPKAELQHDEETGLRYDSDNWYLPDGKTIVYLTPDHPGFSYDDDGNWYDHGKPWDPPATDEPAEPAQLAEQAVAMLEDPAFISMLTEGIGAESTTVETLVGNLPENFKEMVENEIRNLESEPAA